ncbi:hypothetical protein [Legionella sainthelensi]|uniref:hypothetical protein n=1 Tax=Legionella sainthelensi TaxID=28087 RepID=UPI000E205EFB|nr:hypothetical protein [Legionella sainthelensi]
MIQVSLIIRILTGLFTLCIVTAAQAGSPLWTFEPVLGYSPTISINSKESAIIKYTVTNQSKISHTLLMKPIRGITPSGRSSRLGYHQSCILTLYVII